MSRQFWIWPLMYIVGGLVCGLVGQTPVIFQAIQTLSITVIIFYTLTRPPKHKTNTQTHTHKKKEAKKNSTCTTPYNVLSWQMSIGLPYWWFHTARKLECEDVKVCDNDKKHWQNVYPEIDVNTHFLLKQQFCLVDYIWQRQYITEILQRFNTFKPTAREDMAQ